MPRPTYEVTYYRPAQTAALIRAALKRTFPGVKFGVTTSTYSGGASIRIKWTDGPTTEQVESVAGQFAGKGFDGMIDMAYSIRAWVLNGEVIGTQSRGTVDSRGSVPAWGDIPPHDDAELVSFGGCYVSTRREYTAAFIRDALARVVAYWGGIAPEMVPEVVDHCTYGARINATPAQNAEIYARAFRDWDALVYQELAHPGTYSLTA